MSEGHCRCGHCGVKISLCGEGPYPYDVICPSCKGKMIITGTAGITGCLGFILLVFVFSVTTVSALICGCAKEQETNEQELIAEVSAQDVSTKEFVQNILIEEQEASKQTLSMKESAQNLPTFRELGDKFQEWRDRYGGFEVWVLTEDLVKEITTEFGEPLRKSRVVAVRRQIQPRAYPTWYAAPVGSVTSPEFYHFWVYSAQEGNVEIKIHELGNGARVISAKLLGEITKKGIRE